MLSILLSEDRKTAAATAKFYLYIFIYIYIATLLCHSFTRKWQERPHKHDAYATWALSTKVRKNHQMLIERRIHSNNTN